MDDDRSTGLIARIWRAIARRSGDRSPNEQAFDDFRGVFATQRPIIAGAGRRQNLLGAPVGTSLDVVRPSAIGVYRPPSRARRQIFFGAIIVLVMFAGFGTWAALAPIGSAAMAPGTIVDELGRQTIQHLEGGIIKEILVQEGDRVKAGQLLIRLDDTRAKAELATVQGQIDLAAATKARLVAEQSGLERPEFPQDLMARAKTDPRIDAIMTEQMKFFTARLSVLNGQKSILQQQIAQYEQQINGYEAIEQAKGTQLRLVREELGDIIGLEKDGYVTKSRVLALEREAGQLAGDRGQAIAEMARARQGIGEASRQILQLDKQRQEDASKELEALDGQLNDLKEKKIATQDVVNRVNIVSPIDGTVTNLAVHTVDGVISPGATLMEIVPLNDRMIVEAEINPIDVNAVAVGDQVAIRVFVAGGRLTPTIYGRLDGVSADRITVPNSNHTYYKARISIPAEQAARLDDIRLKVGMPVEAMISTGTQTALHYAVKPLLDSITRSFRER